MNKQVFHISLKMTLAGVIALIIAYLLKLEYYTTASAIAILSIQWTKTDFINIAIKRLISGLAAIALASLLFTQIDDGFIAFFIFLLIFTTFSWVFKLSEGIVPSVVIVTHFILVPQVTLAFVIDEILVIIIAILVAFVINMFYPQFSFKKVKHDLHKVDNIISTQLKATASNLIKGNELTNINESKQALRKIMNEAKMVDRDILIRNDHRFITYLYMRRTQLETIELIAKHLKLIKDDHEYKTKVANFIDKISHNINFEDNASLLKEELSEMQTYFMESSLPKTRKEFETRAMLFQIINELSLFLQLKIDFHKQYPTFNQKESD